MCCGRIFAGFFPKKQTSGVVNLLICGSYRMFCMTGLIKQGVADLVVVSSYGRPMTLRQLPGVLIGRMDMAEDFGVRPLCQSDLMSPLRRRLTRTFNGGP